MAVLAARPTPSHAAEPRPRQTRAPTCAARSDPRIARNSFRSFYSLPIWRRRLNSEFPVEASAKMNRYADPAWDRQCPGFSERPRMAQHRAPAIDQGPPRKNRPARFLDLLLHQLHACASRPQAPRTQIQRRTRRDRCSLGQVHHRAGNREHSPGCVAIRDRAPGRERPPNACLAGIRRPCLADFDAHRPAWQGDRSAFGRGRLRGVRPGHRPDDRALRPRRPT